MRLCGEIGKLVVDGEQVGGFRGWTVFVETKPPVCSWVMVAGYWLFKRIDGKVRASFYSGEDQLELIYESDASIELPDEYPLDKMILDPVKISFERKFDWRHEQENTDNSLPPEKN